MSKVFNTKLGHILPCELRCLQSVTVSGVNKVFKTEKDTLCRVSCTV